MDPDHPWGSTGRAQRWAKKVLQNRDGAVGSDVHAAATDSPQGFNTWDEVGSGSKRWAKAQASAARRRRGKAVIQESVRADQGDGE
jgi:hypothetical protein